MSRLFLVRHAQASFLEPDYDKLSTIGEKQARALGAYWAGRGHLVHRVCSGPRERQRKTAAIVAHAYAAARLGFPETVVMPEFDEYHIEAVMEKSLPQLLAADPIVAGLHAAFQGAAENGERRKSFQKLLEEVMHKWVAGEIVPPGVESWDEFCTRVNRGLSRFLAAGARGEQTAIFSSGGPIAVAMQRALRLQPMETAQLSWMSRNCAYSEFLSSGERFTLSTFNAFPHLEDPALLTYR